MENWATNISPTLARAPRAELKRMLASIDWTRFGLDVDAIRTLCERGARFNAGDKSCRVPELWTLWQSYLDGAVSLADVYSSHVYLADAWSSWAVHSRKNLREAFGPRFVDGGLLSALSDPGAIVDLGNGLGITTRVMAEAYPSALVVGTNIRGSIQEAVANSCSGGMFAQVWDLHEAKAFINNNGIERAGLVVGLEYFEHFEMPLAHLSEVLMLLDPEALLIANTFKTGAVGHFDSYLVNNERVSPRSAGNQFWKMLARHGYERREANVWNNRPALWVKGREGGLV